MKMIPKLTLALLGTAVLLGGCVAGPYYDDSYGYGNRYGYSDHRDGRGRDRDERRDWDRDRDHDRDRDRDWRGRD